MIYTNIRKLCRKSRISIAQLEREAGLGHGTVYRWKQSEPTVFKLKTVADYFGVTLDSLLMPSAAEA